MAGEKVGRAGDVDSWTTTHLLLLPGDFAPSTSSIHCKRCPNVRLDSRIFIHDFSGGKADDSFELGLDVC